MKRSLLSILQALAMSCTLVSASAAELQIAPDYPNCVKPTAIHFRHDASVASASGTVLRAENACYTLSARAGQTLTVKANGADDNVVFSVYEPGYVFKQASDGPDIIGPSLPGAGDQDDATSLVRKLPRNGQYLLLFGTTRGAGGTCTVRFEIKYWRNPSCRSWIGTET
ncbi:hypothetical protein HN018_12240 [Lichenicola cladoniae]|uniref:Uncharacterized protein n=1 Tax=Lichenicola cladoniae TaxID=1484109 RepID=A0A6M8HQJ0_9PROT|nr:hypothetical protein [Lichenicola cladoniae]NPD68133.1 hypothetical protein [Acetobacteraceae bacterium]QKE90704.1 hypothetical protein HN018_12240 [Lichenicola cladoniae]